MFLNSLYEKVAGRELPGVCGFTQTSDTLIQQVIMEYVYKLIYFLVHKECTCTKYVYLHTSLCNTY